MRKGLEGALAAALGEDLEAALEAQRRRLLEGRVLVGERRDAARERGHRSVREGLQRADGPQEEAGAEQLEEARRGLFGGLLEDRVRELARPVGEAPDVGPQGARDVVLGVDELVDRGQALEIGVLPASLRRSAKPARV